MQDVAFFRERVSIAIVFKDGKCLQRTFFSPSIGNESQKQNSA
jgi:hypothetical protein